MRHISKMFNHPGSVNEMSLDLLAAQKKVLELMARHTPLEQILASIAEMVETFAPGCRTGLYFVNDGRMKLGAAPSLPEAFTSVVDGCSIGPCHGVCGTASYSGKRMISTNVSMDPIWGDFTGWILSFGIKAAWSNPVLSPDGRVIATVSFYYGSPYEPTLWDFEVGEVAASLMSIAVERKRQEELINEQRLKMLTSSKLAALGEMAAGLAHEINNPLTVIQTQAIYLKLLCQKSRLTEADVLRSTEEIEKTVKRIHGIMKGLKAISKNGDNDPLQQVFAKVFISDTISFCRDRFANNNVKFSIGPFPDDLRILCRPIQLSQALLNLLNNAYDAVAGTERPWVRIELGIHENFFVLSVIDSGPGIPKELRKKIMEPFFSTKGNDRGTGLGLSISRKIVEGHGGILRINEDSPNTRFDIHLPLAPLI